MTQSCLCNAVYNWLLEFEKYAATGPWIQLEMQGNFFMCESVENYDTLLRTVHRKRLNKSFHIGMTIWLKSIAHDFFKLSNTWKQSFIYLRN